MPHTVASCCVPERLPEHRFDAAAPAAPRPIAPRGAAREIRMAAVGVSETRICGVRDHAALLAEALRAESIQCSMHWLYRRERSAAGARAELASWACELREALTEADLDALLFHYSVF